MSQTDLAWFLVAGIIGMIGGYGRTTTATPYLVWGSSLSWAIIALWAFLKLLGAIA